MVHSVIHDVAIKIDSGGPVIRGLVCKKCKTSTSVTGRLCQVYCLDINMIYAVFPKRQVSFARALSACCLTKVEVRSGRSLVPLKTTYNSSARSIVRSICLGSLYAAYR